MGQGAMFTVDDGVAIGQLSFRELVICRDNIVMMCHKFSQIAKN